MGGRRGRRGGRRRESASRRRRQQTSRNASILLLPLGTRIASHLRRERVLLVFRRSEIRRRSVYCVQCVVWRCFFRWWWHFVDVARRGKVGWWRLLRVVDRWWRWWLLLLLLLLLNLLHLLLWRWWSTHGAAPLCDRWLAGSSRWSHHARSERNNRNKT
jgi:hypothetical protein